MYTNVFKINVTLTFVYMDEKGQCENIFSNLAWAFLAYHKCLSKKVYDLPVMCSVDDDKLEGDQAIFL